MDKRSIPVLAEETGNGLFTPLDAAPWVVPSSLSLVEGNLHWTVAEYPTTATGDLTEVGLPNDVKWRQRLFADFLGLASAADGSVLRFATHWGLLGLCEHLDRLPSCPLCSRALPGSSFLTRGIEPVAGWRRFSALALSLVRVGVKLRESESVRASDWKDVREAVVQGRVGEMLDRVGFFGTSAITPEVRLSKLVNAMWLQSGGATLVLDWPPDRPTIQFGEQKWDGLFPMMGVQLATAIVSSPEIFVCSACADPFFRSRRVKSGQRNYCPRPDCQR